jgi:hypothetical protein
MNTVNHYSVWLSEGPRSFIPDKLFGSIKEAHEGATEALDEAGNAYTFEDAGPWKLEIFDELKEPGQNVVATLYGVPRNWHYA